MTHDAPLRHCPDCGARVAKITEECVDGRHGLFIIGRRVRLFGDRIVYACPKCDHEFTVPLGKHTLTSLLVKLKGRPA